jgi:SAM-dependent methyltransferase
MISEFEPHLLEWNQATVTRFWNWNSRQARTQELYFSRLSGDAILAEASRYLNLRQTVIDLGAGPGYLTEKLIRSGADVRAVDISPDSIAQLDKRLGGQKHLLGSYVSTTDRVPLPDACADLIFIVETVEHLEDDALDKLLREAHRLLRPGAAVIITTPNAERLDLNRVLCPHCGSIFHVWQHVRSWSSHSLDDLMSQYNFNRITCEPTFFSYLPAILRPFHRLAYTVSGKKLPHLLYIGRKS